MGVSKEEKSIGEEEKETYEPIDSYDTFCLEGKKVTLPISWSELSEMGFRINVSDKNTISSEIGFVEKEIYNSAGECLGKVSIVNNTDSDIKVEDGIVNVFTFSTNVDMNFYGGLSFLSTKEQVYETCGEPKYHVYEGKEESEIHVLSKEQENESDNDYDYNPTSSYRWCKSDWLTATENTVLDYDLGLYVTKNNYHYLEVTFDENENISEIVFYFDCAEEIEEDNSMEDSNDSENLDDDLDRVSPATITDLFDGEKRVWFFIDHRDSFDGLAYDNDVKGVLITEDKQVKGYYYNLVGSLNHSLSEEDCIINSNSTNPCANNRYVLSDFEGLNNEEIINKVSASYGDASVDYDFEYEGEEYYFEKCDFPYEITYEGDLDASGNNFESEELCIFNNPYNIHFTFNGSFASEYISSSFKFSSIIKPSIIKDKEYVGIKDRKGNMLITENTYLSFENIGFDSPNNY